LRSGGLRVKPSKADRSHFSNTIKVSKKFIESGQVNPGFVLNKEIRLEEAAKAYLEFSDHKFFKAVIRFDDIEEKERGEGSC